MTTDEFINSGCSKADEKPRQTFLNRLKQIRRYFSNPTLQHHHHHHHHEKFRNHKRCSAEKPPKSIQCQQGHITEESSQNMTSPKILHSSYLNRNNKTNHWTLKHFKNRIKTSTITRSTRTETHGINADKQKSSTISVEPTRDMNEFETQYHNANYHGYYFPMKESENVLMTDQDPTSITTHASIDDVSLQSISIDSFSFDGFEADEEEEFDDMKHQTQQQQQKKITNLDESLTTKDSNYSPIIVESDFVSTILRETGLYHKESGNTELQQQQQQQQEHKHQPTLKHLTHSINNQLSMSDIYSIFASHDHLETNAMHSNQNQNSNIKTTNYQSKYSMFNSLKRFSMTLNTSTLNNGSTNNNSNDSKAKNSTFTSTSLSKSNLRELGLRLKRYFHGVGKSKTLPTVEVYKGPSEKKPSSELVNEYKSLNANLNQLQGYFEHENTKRNNNNNSIASRHGNNINTNSINTLISDNYPSDLNDSSLRLNKTFGGDDSIPEILTSTSTGTTRTDQLISSPRRSSSSLARYRHRNEEKTSSSTSATAPTSTPGNQRLSHYSVEHSEYHSDTLPQYYYMPTLFSSESKSSSLSKESGGRKILNFLQRGFQSKRPKSMMKSERLKNQAKRRSGSSSSLDSHLHKKSSSTVSIDKAISCLAEQIQLPFELYQAFHVKPPTEYAVKTSCLSNGSAGNIGRLTQICNIDPSLIGSSISNHNNNKNRCHYCFQVMSPSQRLLMTSSTSGLQPNHEERNSTDKNYLTRSMSGEMSTTSSPIITNMYDNNSPSKASSPTSAAAATTTPVTLQSQGSTTEETVNIPFVIYNYSCQSALERDRWVQYLKRLVNPGQDTQRRKENCLNVWIQEAKGLTVKNRYFCTILVNGTICARTTIKQMTDMLFWGEEFDLSGLTDCSYLTIEIWKACEIGKSTSSPSSHRHRNNSPSNRRRGDDAKNTSPPAAIRKAMMTCTRAVAEDGSVSPPDFTAFRNSAILDDFPIMNNGDAHGGCAGQKRRKFKTSSSTSKVDKKSTLVATININLLDISNSGDVESWYSPDSTNNPNASNNSIMLSSCLKHQSSDPNELVPVQQKSKSKAKSRSSRDPITNCVQIRVKIRYRALTVLPLTSYARLEANLCQFQMPKTFQRQEHQLLQMTGSTLLFNGSNSLTTSISQKPDLIQLLSSLDPWLNVKAKAELAGAIVVLQQARGQVIEFLASLILCEVRKQTDPNMVLRANSIATKATEIYLRLVGGSYLPTILSDFVKIVISGIPVDPLLVINNRQHPIDYEVDISKVQTSSQLAQNQVNLLSLVELVWKKILTSEDKFPEQFRALFIEIRQYLDGSKGSYLSSTSVNSNVSSSNVSVIGVGVDNGNGTLCEHVISACLFLRYICPAILSPSLFNLTHEFPSESRVLRAFTLVAKTIQTLANFSLFSGSKEAYMKFMNQFVTDQLPEMRRFLHSISMPIGKASMHSTSSPSQKSLNSNSTAVLKPINNNNSISRHANGDNNHSNRNSQNGSTPHSLHMISSSDENFLKVSKLSSTRRLNGDDDRGCGGSSTSSENRIGNSQSHHGGFMGENNGLPTNTSVPVSINSRGKIHKSHVVKSPMKQQSSQELSKHKTYQEVSTTLNCIALPPLPSYESQHSSSHQPQNHLGSRDHVDLPLCLALCHLQLCEAIDKVPEEKRQSDINELKIILDEISMFLTSGKDPQPNWWWQKKANTNSEEDNSPSSIIVINTDNTTMNNTTTAITKKVENFHNTSRSHSKSPHPLLKKNTSQTTMRIPANYIGETHNKSTISLDDEKITQLPSTLMLSAPSSTGSLKQQIIVPEKKRKPTGNNKNHYKTMPSSNVEIIVSKSQQNHHTAATTAVTTPTTSPSPTNIPPERIIRCDSIEILKVPYTTNTTDGFYHSIEVKKNQFPSTNSPIQPKTSLDFIVDSKLAKESPTDSSLKVDHRKWRKGRIESPQKKKSHESVVIYRETNDTTTTGGERLQAKLDSPVSAEMNPTEFSEDPSVMSSNCVLGNYSISSGYHTISSRCGNNQVISTPNHNTLLTSLSDEISSSTSVNNPLYTCHSLKQINNSNVSNYDNSIEYFSDKDTILLTNNNNSVGGCNNSSSSSKKPNSNSSRRHTYVNLGNSHETNHLIDTIKNGDHHSHHQQRSDQTIELDRRNWAPPVYILPDERRNRRATLTTTYPNTNEVNRSGNSASSKDQIHQPTSDPQELQHGSSSSSSMRRLETKLERIKFGTKEIPRTIGAPAGKRTALFPKENKTPAIIDIRSELDASQARLAEAQARLLANEAERIQLLRSWRSELIKQSQLINASSLNQNQTTTMVYDNPTEPQQQYPSNLRITHTGNKDPTQLSFGHNDGDDGENDDNSDRDYNDMITNEPRSLSVIPLINTNSLQRQDLHHYYAESIYDYEDSELMHCNNNNNNNKNNVDPDHPQKSKRSTTTTDRYIHLPMSNSNNGSTVGRHSGMHQNTPGSSVKSQRSYSNRPRMGASAIVTNLHDHSTTSSASADNYQQSTLPGRGKLITQHHHWNNGNHKNTNPNTSSETMMTTPSSTDLDEFYRLSRSPSTPGLCINNSSSSNNHSKYSPHTTVPSVTTTTTPPATTTIPQQITGTDEEFARQIQAIIYENNQHLCSK